MNQNSILILTSILSFAAFLLPYSIISLFFFLLVKFLCESNRNIDSSLLRNYSTSQPRQSFSHVTMKTLPVYFTFFACCSSMWFYQFFLLVSDYDSLVYSAKIFHKRIAQFVSCWSSKKIS
jgi:hypothetical protein